MSTLFIMVMFIFIIIAICLILMAINNKGLKKNTSSLLKKLEHAAKENNLAFASHELLKNCAFGLDTVQQKLLVVKRNAGTGYETVSIDLAGLKTCAKKKTWMQLRPDKSAKYAEKHLEKIALELIFTGNEPRAELVFYEYRYNSLFEMPELEQKAQHWESLFAGIENASVKKYQVPV